VNGRRYKKTPFSVFEECYRTRAESERDAQTDRWFEGVDQCESPIEEMMMAGLLCTGPSFREIGEWPFVAGHEPFNDIDPFTWSAGRMIIAPQFKVKTFRLDFALFFGDVDERVWVGVECDGHDFHERTKDQAARDRSRDRDLLAAGWPIVRFTGAEIYADAYAKGEEAWSAIESIYLRSKGIGR